MKTVVGPVADISSLLDRWVADGLITADQARRMQEYVSPQRDVSHTPLVIEAMGYLGGVLVLVALSLVSG